MDKYLIINADDFGMCHSANLAVADLFKSGGITSATIMAPCAWAYEAVNFAKANPANELINKTTMVTMEQTMNEFHIA